MTMRARQTAAPGGLERELVERDCLQIGAELHVSWIEEVPLHLGCKPEGVAPPDVDLRARVHLAVPVLAEDQLREPTSIAQSAMAISSTNR